jgi:predicted metal-dependent phosphoesterase TrpH
VTFRHAQGQPEPRRGLIDLHLHTTASDGRCSPAELVEQARAVGLTVMAVTDHDTTAAVADVRRLAMAHGIEAVAGIEITAVDDGFDVHILGYFLEPGDRMLQQFLAAQREIRLDRVKEVAARLGTLGMPVDIEPVLAAAGRDASRAVGRPQVARAMIAAGYVASVDEAFTAWLARGRPAFVPRAGASPESVIATIHAARGIASLAHPGRTRIDSRIAALRDAGLDALEAFHSDHDPAERMRYVQLAASLGVRVTGGSDFHGDPARAITPGSTTLPPEHWATLCAARAPDA